MSYSDFFSDYPGALNDRVMALLADNGAAEGAMDDRWAVFFDLNAVPAGSFPDRMRAFLLAYLDIPDDGQAVRDLWNLISGPYTNAPPTPPLSLITMGDLAGNTTIERSDTATYWGPPPPPLALITLGALVGNTTLARTTTATYWST